MSVDSNHFASTLPYNGAQPVDRQGMVTGLEHAQSTILAVAGARVYHTKLDNKDDQAWKYSQWKGTLTFGRDIDNFGQGSSSGLSTSSKKASKTGNDSEHHWFRLADSETGRTVWMFKFPENLNYLIDRPFFHIFQGRTRKYGLLFNDDEEASSFGKKVFSEIYGGQPQSNSKKSRKAFAPARSKSLSATHSLGGSGGFNRSLISSPTPNSFKHVSHVGVNKEGLFETTKDLDDKWKSMLTDLQGHGVSEAVAMQHSDFVEGFWKGVEAATQKAESTNPKKVAGGSFQATQEGMSRRRLLVASA